MRRFLQLFLGVLFLAFAYLQVNDPDPFLWVVIYGAVGVVCLLAAIRGVNRRLILAFIAILLIYAVTLLPGFWTWLNTSDKQEIFGEMVYKKSYIEETREFLGLLMASAALTFIYYNPKK
jgi:uncharacterized membrane protein